MTDEKQYLSAEKYKELEAEIKELTTTERKSIAERLEHAKSFGDLKENSEYQEARAEQARLESRIIELQNLLRTAEIVDSHHSTKVEIGSTVHIQKEGEREKKVIHVVGSSEADFKENKISNESPLGTALMGMKKGDKAEVKTPKGVNVYKIVNIE